MSPTIRSSRFDDATDQEVPLLSDGHNDEDSQEGGLSPDPQLSLDLDASQRGAGATGMDENIELEYEQNILAKEEEYKNQMNLTLIAEEVPRNHEEWQNNKDGSGSAARRNDS